MVTFYTESIDIENNETEAEEKEYIEQALCRYVNLYHLYIYKGLHEGMKSNCQKHIWDYHPKSPNHSILFC